MNSTGNITTEYSAEKKQMTIYVEGAFDISLQRDFRNCYEHLDKTVDVFVIDLDRTSAIDSTGLGTIIAFKDYTSTAKIKIVHAHGDVKESLELSNLNQLFAIE